MGYDDGDLALHEVVKEVHALAGPVVVGRQQGLDQGDDGRHQGLDKLDVVAADVRSQVRQRADGVEAKGPV